MTHAIPQNRSNAAGVIDDPKRTYLLANVTIRNLLDTMPLHFYHYLRRIGYSHRSAVISVLMRFSPSKEDLCKRLQRRRNYYKEAR